MEGISNMSSYSLERAAQNVWQVGGLVSNTMQDGSLGSVAAKRGAKLGAAVVLGYVSLALTTFAAGIVPHILLACAEALHKAK
jgi:hypothetical protein